MRKQFIQEFGITMNLPGYMINTTRLYPKNAEYLVSFEHYAFPQDQTLVTLYPSTHQQNLIDDQEDNGKHNHLECALTLRKQRPGFGCKIVDQYNFSSSQIFKKKFKFSPQGQYFVVSGSIEGDQIDVYESSSDIETLLSNKVAKGEVLSKIRSSEIKEAQKLIFSQDEETLMIGTNRVIANFRIKDGQRLQTINIPQQYERLMSLHLSAGSIMALCKRADDKICDLMRVILTPQKKVIGRLQTIKSIRYNQDESSEIKVIGKVSNDEKRCYINNEGENILYDQQSQVQIVQLPWFRNRRVLKMKEVQLPPPANVKGAPPSHSQPQQRLGFLCLTTNKNDYRMTLLHTNDAEFKISIPRMISLKNYQVHDMKFSQETGVVNILSVRDGELFIDCIDLKYSSAQKKEGTVNDEMLQQSMYYDSPFKSLNFQWPYFYYISHRGEAIVASMNHLKSLYRFVIPPEIGLLSTIIIAENHELHFATFLNNKYNIYSMENLKVLIPFEVSKTPKTYQYKLLISYDHNVLVSGQPLYSLWVKPSSSRLSHFTNSFKESTSDCRLFMLHRFTMLSCFEGQEGPPQQVAFMRHPKYVDSETIYYDTSSDLPGDRESRASICVKRLSIVYSSLKKDVIYQETRENCKVTNFSYDYVLKRVYILIKDNSLGKTKYQLVVVDGNTMQQLQRVDVTQRQDFIGEFRSGIHFFLNSNFYYQNSMLTNPASQAPYRYDNLLPSQDSIELMIFYCPLISQRYRRLLYIKKDVSGKALRTAYVMPYLDERKVVIRARSKPQCFWTLIGMDESDIEPVFPQPTTSEGHNRKEIELMQLTGMIDSKGVGVKRTEEEKLVNGEPAEEQKTVAVASINAKKEWWNSGSIAKKQISKILDISQTLKFEPKPASKNQKIVCIGMQHEKIQIFSMKGQLEQVIPFFSTGQLEFKQPVAVSQDGRTFIFRSQEYPYTFSIHSLDLHNGFSVTNWTLSLDDLILNHEEALSVLLPDFKKEELKTDEQMLPSPHVNASQQDQGDTSSLIQNARETQISALNAKLSQIYQLQVQVNNEGDIAVSLIETRQNAITRMLHQGVKKQVIQQFDVEPSPEYLSQKEKDYGIRSDKKRRVFMVIKRGPSGNQIVKMIDNIRHFPHVKFPKWFLLTKENMFFWNLQNIYYWNHTAKTNVINKIGFSIPVEDWQRNTLKTVSTSANEIKDHIILIQVKLSPKLDTIIVWDLKADIEIDSYDVTPESQIMFDEKGDIFILDQDHVIINSSGCRCFSFQVQGGVSNRNFAKLDRGCRIDPLNSNYMLLPNNLHLTTSYLSIVINLENVQKEYSERVFEPLAYPYYFNRESELHQLVNDPGALEQLLNYFEEKDQRKLDHILLLDKNRLTPLHFATEAENAQSISILLKKLSVVKVNNAFSIKDIFDNFLDYAFFKDYLNICYFQTIQMKSIQSLNIPPLQEGETAWVVSHSHSYLTKDLFNQVIYEGAASVPVDVKGFDLYWILNTEEGRKFLLKLCDQTNYDFFTTEFISTMIYFLWSHYKIRIIGYQMIPFIAYFGLFISLSFYNELYFKEDEMQFAGSQKQVMTGLCIALFIIIAYFYVLIILTCLSLGRIFWEFFWVWLSLVSNSLNLAVVILTLQQSSSQEIRRVESVAVILMWFRFLYFFRILDSTAPLIRMIYQIVYDMRAFVFIFVLFILGFANGFYVLAKNQHASNAAIDIPYLTYGQSIIYVYMTSIGEFGTDTYSSSSGDSGLLWAFFVLTTFLLSIVLLNMLIAMMGQSYETVAQVAEASMLKERMQMIMENFFLKRVHAFNKAKYLISFAPQKKNDEESAQESMMERIEKKMGVVFQREISKELQRIREEIISGERK